MKRMSEVFELPVSVSLMGDEHAGEITKGDHPHYCLEDNNYWMLSDIEQTQHAAHAINHVDALADALDECLEDMELEGKQDDRVYRLAKAALAAYRGGV